MMKLTEQYKEFDALFKNYKPQIEFKKTKNGQLDSSNCEGQILNEIKQFLLFNYPTITMNITPPKYWNDFELIFPSGFKIPVNLKVVDLDPNTGSNLCSPPALIHCFTNFNFIDALRKPGKDKTLRSKVLCKIFSEYKSDKETNKDYFFLIIDKNTHQVIPHSLRRFSKLASNPKNPLQANWKNNITPIQKSYKESRKICLGAFVEALQKSVDGNMNIISSIGNL